VCTYIEIDDPLLSEAMLSSGARTKKAAVEAGSASFAKGTIPVCDSSTLR
jgi:Bacterial antitoxin of type II TA system, VapB